MKGMNKDGQKEFSLLLWSCASGRWPGRFLQNPPGDAASGNH